jgi:TetR/AcrR family transcriptional repressor of nem operon
LATREKILRAANDLFYVHGYHATGLDRVIAEAGVAKGNFYYHFRNKEQLATAVLDWHRDQALAEIGVDPLHGAGSPVESLLRLLQGMSSRMLHDGDGCRVRGCFFGNFALELSTGSEAVRGKVKEIFDGFRSLIRSLLERARAEGEIGPAIDPDRAAGVILGLMEGAVLLDKTSQEPEEVPNALAFIRGYLEG